MLYSILRFRFSICFSFLETSLLSDSTLSPLDLLVSLVLDSSSFDSCKSISSSFACNVARDIGR